MSLFQTLSGVFNQGQKQPSSKPKHKPTHSTPKQKTPKHKPHKQAVDTSGITREAEAKAREIILDARNEALKVLQQAEQSARDSQSKLTAKQSEIDQKMFAIEKQQAVLQEKENYIKRIEAEAVKVKEEVEKLKQRLLKKLETTASLTKEEAKKQILAVYEKRLTADIAKRVKEAEDTAKEEADEVSKRILVDAMKHGAHDYVAEYTVSTLKIPDEEAKGRIIGKSGRNIRAFERAAGVDVDLDETPGEIRISSFDAVRREIARQALSRLIRDGRIQPTRIEEYVAKAKREVEKVMFEEGKKLCQAVGVYNLPHDLIAMLGKFKYRTSYGQNMISHTLEETKIGMALAQEIGANVDTVRLGCLLHDIGKVVSDEQGSHVELGVNLLKKYQIPKEVIDCVAQHHEDEPFTSSESVLVYIADAISGARPGARYENYEEYVKRLSKLEEIATSYAPVAEAYAIQAGREIRVIVNPKKISDDEMIKLASDIKDRIKNEMTYPGTVTVTVVRETRATDVAK